MATSSGLRRAEHCRSPSSWPCLPSTPESQSTSRLSPHTGQNCELNGRRELERTLFPHTGKKCVRSLTWGFWAGVKRLCTFLPPRLVGERNLSSKKSSDAPAQEPC